MRLGVVMPIYPKFMGGGVKHAHEVVIRLVSHFDKVLLFPASDSFFLISNEQDKERILEAVEQYEKIGIEVNQAFYDVLTRFKPMSMIEKAINVMTLDFTKKLVRAYINSDNFKVDFLFDPSFVLPDVILLSKSLSIKYGFTHQANVISRSLLSRVYKVIRFTGLNSALPYEVITQIPPSFILNHVRRLIKNHKPSFIALLSKGQLELLGIDKWDVPYYILDPANAIDPSILKYRTDNKENYFIFYARLHPEKGLFELPKIVRLAKKECPDIHVKVMGSFPNDTIKAVFFKLINKYKVNDNIEYLGFVSDAVKYETVARAKALIYPSHSDYFSLVILETISLKTPVIAYRTPGPFSIFNGINCVRFIDEFNKKAFAKEIINLCNRNGLACNNIDTFITKYFSWDLIAKQIMNLIKNYINYNMNLI